MTDIESLKGALSHFANLDEESFNLSLDCWKIQTYKKGDIYNPVGNICRFLGFTMEGYFRAYLIGKNGEEVNLFLYPPHQVVVTYKSFIHQSPCEFTTEALTDAAPSVLRLPICNRCTGSHMLWERFGD
jgi:hypothetical protein